MSPILLILRMNDNTQMIKTQKLPLKIKLLNQPFSAPTAPVIALQMLLQKLHVAAGYTAVHAVDRKRAFEQVISGGNVL